MTTLAVKNSDCLATLDEARREIKHGALFGRDNVIAQAAAASRQADRMAGALPRRVMCRIYRH